jgi:hypothetical protein
LAAGVEMGVASVLSYLAHTDKNGFLEEGAEWIALASSGTLYFAHKETRGCAVDVHGCV